MAFGHSYRQTLFLNECDGGVGGRPAQGYDTTSAFSRRGFSAVSFLCIPLQRSMVQSPAPSRAAFQRAPDAAGDNYNFGLCCLQPSHKVRKAIVRQGDPDTQQHPNSLGRPVAELWKNPNTHDDDRISLTSSSPYP